MAVVQLRNPTEGRAYYDRKVAAGKTPMEAMRALKRRLLAASLSEAGIGAERDPLPGLGELGLGEAATELPSGGTGHRDERPS